MSKCYQNFLRLGLISLFTCLFSFAVQAAPLLNGVASHTELNNEKFIGALYLETLTDNNLEAINNVQAKRLALRISAARLSARRLNKMWLEGIAINAPEKMVQEQADNLIAFSKMLKGSLSTGDQLLFDFQPGFGTTVSLNGFDIGHIASDDFFTLLLITWVGSVPLSSEFRDSLLTAGSIDKEILSRFDSLTPQPSRIQIAQAWSQSEPAASESETTPAEPIVSPTPPVAAIAKPTLNAPTLAAPTALPTPSTQSKAGSKPTPTAAPSQPEVASAPEPVDTPAPTKPIPATTAQSAAEDDEMEADEPELTVETLLAQQRYTHAVIKRIYAHISYPKRAALRGQAGSVRLQMTLSRYGELLKLEEVTPSPHKLLNQAASSAVRDSVPFPPMPAAIGSNSFTINLPVTFKLPD